MLSTLGKQLFSSYSKFPTAYIVAAKRSPIGCFMGKLSDISVLDLGIFLICFLIFFPEATVIKDAVKQINLDTSIVDEVILGCVI